MSAEESDFSEIRGALGSIGLSAIIVLGGSILSQAMGFGTRIILTRFLPVNGYGEIVLGITVLNVLGLLSIVGLGQAQTRYLPQAKSKEERQEVAGVIYQIGIGLSIIWAGVGFVSADFIAGTVFDRPEMTNVIRVFALSLPFYVFYKLSLKGIQGHRETTPNILTRNVVHPISRIGAVAVFALGGFGAIGLSIGYTSAFAFGGIAAFVFFLRTDRYRIRALLRPASKSRYQEILSFSLPLAASASFGLVTSHTDRFLLGVFGTGEAVGVYDVTFLLAQFILFFGPVLNYLFQPIMSEYDGKDDVERMGQLYTIITRWLVILTFPIFALLVLFPEILLGTFFGNEYQAGSMALSVLAVGYFAGRTVGLSNSYLVATGDSKVMMYISGATAALNVGLNIVLIPTYGVVGAAIATVGSTLLNNGTQALYIYRITGIHPFERELLVPLVPALVGISLTAVLLPGSSLNVIEAGIVTGVLSCVLLLCILLTRSVYVVELKIADSMLDKVGLDLDLNQRLKMLTTE
jgi:O-antigen/teichoic acid export membrane protein